MYGPVDPVNVKSAVGEQSAAAGFGITPLGRWVRTGGPPLTGTLSLGGRESGGRSLSPGLLGVCLDYITISTSTEGGGYFLGEYPLHLGTGGHWTQFGQSEMYEAPMGFVTRRWEPRGSSKRFGDQFESWEAAGEVARFFGLACVGQVVVPTRLDFAFDYQCLEDLCPMTVAEWLVPGTRAYLDDPLHVPRPETKLGEPESRGSRSRTVYFGSRKSEWSVCIYRRDLRPGSVVSKPELRIEVRLRRKWAESIWPFWEESSWKAFAAVSEMFRERSGCTLCDHDGEVPEREADPPAGVVNSIVRMFEQYAEGLELIRQGELISDECTARLLGALRSRVSHRTRQRRASRRRQLEHVGKERLEQQLWERLGDSP